MTNFLKCKRCGHPLRDPESQLKGYGPICFKKVQDDEYVQLDLSDF
jgi:hypothetical protein